MSAISPNSKKTIARQWIHSQLSMIQIPNSSSCNSVCSLMFRIDSNSSYVLVIIEHWWKSNRRQLIVWTFLCAIYGKGRETHRKTIDSPHNFLRLWSVNVIICSVVFRVDKFQFVNVDMLKSSQHQMFDRTLSAILGKQQKPIASKIPAHPLMIQTPLYFDVQTPVMSWLWKAMVKNSIDVNWLTISLHAAFGKTHKTHRKTVKPPNNCLRSRSVNVINVLLYSDDDKIPKCLGYVHFLHIFCSNSKFFSKI